MVYENIGYGLLAFFILGFFIWFVFIKDDDDVKWIKCNDEGGICERKGKIKYGQGDKWVIWIIPMVI
jgi:hypothetical protein